MKLAMTLHRCNAVRGHRHLRAITPCHGLVFERDMASHAEAHGRTVEECKFDLVNDDESYSHRSSNRCECGRVPERVRHGALRGCCDACASSANVGVRHIVRPDSCELGDGESSRAAYMRHVRAKAKEEGKCNRCLKRPAAPYASACKECIASQKSWEKRRYG